MSKIYKVVRSAIPLLGEDLFIVRSESPQIRIDKNAKRRNKKRKVNVTYNHKTNRHVCSSCVSIEGGTSILCPHTNAVMRFKRKEKL